MEDIPLNNTRTLRRMGKPLLEKQLIACKAAVMEKK